MESGVTSLSQRAIEAMVRRKMSRPAAMKAVEGKRPVELWNTIMNRTPMKKTAFVTGFGKIAKASHDAAIGAGAGMLHAAIKPHAKEDTKMQRARHLAAGALAGSGLGLIAGQAYKAAHK
jgi:hypothetical protein